MNTTSQVQQPMNTTILSYPGFQTLPRGIKQMLVASEAHFFDQPASHHTGNARPWEDGLLGKEPVLVVAGKMGRMRNSIRLHRFSLGIISQTDPIRTHAAITELLSPRTRTARPRLALPSQAV